MGCSSSKQVETRLPTPKSRKVSPEAEVKPVDAQNVIKPLERAVVPSIPVQESIKILKPIAFEIPLDQDLKQCKILPKLNLTQTDILAKLANTEARWNELANSPRFKRNVKTDVVDLKKRLEEKEAIAAQNRLREIQKLQKKLAKQEKHAKEVMERKKLLLESSDKADAVSSLLAPIKAVSGVKGILNLKALNEGANDNDSGLGSSLGGSRSGSGRSNILDDA